MRQAMCARAKFRTAQGGARAGPPGKVPGGLLAFGPDGYFAQTAAPSFDAAALLWA